MGKLRQLNIPLVPHRAVQMTRADYDYYDFLIGMDDVNTIADTYKIKNEFGIKTGMILANMIDEEYAVREK